MVKTWYMGRSMNRITDTLGIFTALSMDQLPCPCPVIVGQIYG